MYLSKSKKINTKDPKADNQPIYLIYQFFVHNVMQIKK